MNHKTFEKMSFNEISEQIWSEMQTGSSAPKPYTADFHGANEDEEGIDFEDLLYFLNKYFNYIREEFNYSDFAAGTRIETHMALSGRKWRTIRNTVPDNTPFQYAEETGETRIIPLTGLLNKRPGHLEKGWGYIVSINPFDEELSITLRIYYLNTMKYREPILETADDDDFRIPKKYVAIALTAGSFVDFCDIIGFIWGEKSREGMRASIADEIAERLRYYKEAAHLNFLYSNIPDFAVPLLGEKLKIEDIGHHLPQLYNYDVVGPFRWFKDSSVAVINFFRIIGSKDPERLLKFFVDNQEAVRLLYYAMNGVSTIDGQTAGTSLIFANMIYALCVMNAYKGLTTKKSAFRIGRNYELDSNVLEENDPKGKILLVQYQKRMKYVTHTFTSPTTMAPAGEFGGFENVSEEFFRSFYSPLDLVTLVDMDSENKTRYLVPAIYVKALSDEEEWKKIKQNLRIGADLLAIIIGVATLGTASPLLLTLALVDIGLSTADMIVAIESDELMKTEEGRQFLEQWEDIMLVGGIVAAGPALLQSTFRMGARLFAVATVAETRKFLRASLLKIMLEVNISNYTKNSVKILETTTEIITESGSLLKETQITNLSEAGVLFVTGEKIVAKTPQRVFGVVYNGKLIAEGTSKAVRDKLKSILNLSGDNLVRELDRLVGINRFLPKGCEIISAKDGYVFMDMLTDEMIGYVEVKKEYLQFAIYRKGLKTKISGSRVYDSLIEHVKINRIKYKGVKGLWGADSDNTAAFNEAIANGLSEEKAAFETWSGRKAKNEGFTKVKIDNLKPENPPYTSISVTFY
jgi:hypothetical protein